jgi:hypothetical protein
LQDVFGALGARLLGKRRRPEVPHALTVCAVSEVRDSRVLRPLDWQAAELVMRPPTRGRLCHLTVPRTAHGLRRCVIVLGVSLADRCLRALFCKYLCPTGALLGLFPRLAFLCSSARERVYRLSRV